MRLCSTVSAVSMVLCLALSAGAQPVQTPPAAQPGAVEAANAPKDDAEARALLNECVAAIKKMGPVSFKARYGMSGAMVIDGNADVRFVRNNAVPGDSLFWSKGRLQMPALRDPDFHVSRYADEKTGKRVAYQDDNAKVVYDRPEGLGPDGKETVGNQQMGLVLRSMLMPPLISPVPFSDELKESRAGGDVTRAPCVFLPDESVGGEMCKVVKVVFKAGVVERKIWISANDKLPRKYEQFRGMSRQWEMLDLAPIQGGMETAKLKTPDGYRFDKSDEVKKVVSATEPTLPPPPPPSGGPQNGQIAPDWDLKTPDGAAVSLASLKGETVVVNFGGSRFPQSWANQAAAAKGLEGKPVKIVSIACRESDPARAAKAFADAKGVGRLLLDGDATATLYNLRGFPSTCVIGPDGKVKAFFESVPTEAELIEAVGSPTASK